MYELLLILAIPLIIPLVILVTQSGLFVPLPMYTVRKILRLAKIRKNDILYDLGSGDGRVVIEAAKRYGIKTVGIEKNKLLAWISRMKVKRNEIENRVKIINGDIFKQDLSDASIVVVYLTQKLNEKLKPKLERELKKGTRVISASHVFKGWKEVKKIKTGHFYTYLYKT